MLLLSHRPTPAAELPSHRLARTQRGPTEKPRKVRHRGVIKTQAYPFTTRPLHVQVRSSASRGERACGERDATKHRAFSSPILFSGYGNYHASYQT